MITIRVNLVALIVAGVIGFAVWVPASQKFGALDTALIMVATFMVIRVYDWMANLPAFKGGSKKKGGEK